MKKTIFPLFLITISLAVTAFQTAPNQAKDLLSRMLTAVENQDQMTYTMKAWERIDGELNYTEIFTKLQEEPKRKMYLKNLNKPNKGVEILWIEGKWDGEAYVKPNSFPYMNLTLSPYGSLMRKKQHHTIHSTGFVLLSEIMKDAIKRAESRKAADEVFHYKGTETHNGRECHKVVIEDPTFTYQSYTVKEGEDLDDIARNRNICAYLIIEKNDGVDDFDDVHEGQTIQIPSSYAKKTILYIDTEYELPIGQHMHDEKGLFERYEFENFDPNPSLTAEEFSPDYEEYGF